MDHFRSEQKFSFLFCYRDTDIRNYGEHFSWLSFSLYVCFLRFVIVVVHMASRQTMAFMFLWISVVNRSTSIRCIIITTFESFYCFWSAWWIDGCLFLYFFFGLGFFIWSYWCYDFFYSWYIVVPFRSIMRIILMINQRRHVDLTNDPWKRSNIIRSPFSLSS